MEDIVPQKTYKVVGIVTWEIDLPIDVDKETAIKEAKEFLDSIVVSTPCVRTAVRIDKLKKAKSRIKRLASFEPEDILSKITREDSRHEFNVDGTIHSIRLNSQRYFVFRNSRHCVSCGLEGTIMVLEKYPNQESPHFNLYGVEDDELVLMTKDHIRSKANGGQDRHSNYQTMCSICNNLKGSHPMPLEGVKQLRKAYDDFKGKVSRRAFTQKVEEIQNQYSEANYRIGRLARKVNSAQLKAEESTLAANVDLNIYKLPDGTYLGLSVYETLKSEEGAEQVACLRAGELLEPIDDDGVFVNIKYNGSCFRVNQGLIRYET